MRCDSLLRIALIVVVTSSFLGCRALRHRHQGCSTCGASMGESFVVGDSFVSGGVISGDTGCTTCQKSFDLADDGMLMTEPYLAESPEFLSPPTDMPQPSYSVNPTDEQPIRPEPAPAEPSKPVTVEKPTPAEPAPITTEAKPRPAGINVDVKSSMSVAMVGQDVVFEVTLGNTGGASIDSVDMTATLSDGLRPISVSPEGVARIDGQRVIFEQVRSFAPMTLSYRITAEATAGMPESRLTLEVKSPILSSGPIKRETVVRITP